ncbi:DNA polymerase [Carboxylicivirga linearis]|uniref:DNA-directed DNA polymerase family A palm domain-containing protein n=1 Tax=Carboxylicivirga linearis TaxID=1628157 RepID=A0ABS5K1Q8_9BACT|nr:DNA polymerase [Carboxylicivirga linearis]MBS2101089.1 hypothetical protein [Carboxylicivirga linearis]
MREFVVFYIYNKWYYHNISENKNGVATNLVYNKIFNSNDIYYCTQVSEFIKQYSEFSTAQLPILIDIESYSKQFIQKSKPLENQDKWNLFKLLKERQLLPNGFQIAEDNIFEYIQKVSEFILEISENTAFLEKERFENVEIPVNRIIYERQREGIAVDVESAKEKIEYLEETVFNTKIKLQLDFKIFSPEKKEVQLNWLERNGIGITGSIERTFKNYSKLNEGCKLFYDLIRNQKDLDSFLDILARRGGNSRTFPSFHGFGTITSRITLREPALQNIRRNNRGIIKPDEDCTFLYIDYSQFEAGILASISNDDKLCKLYDSDIYSDMISNIGGTIETRDDAKIEFYKFMYGASNLLPAVNRYFSKFKKLKAYKKKIEKEAAENKIIGTEMGNYRNVKGNIEISLSHVIQATASLIFKKAIIKVNKEIPEAQFVLPMHDAALYQVNNKYDFEEITNKVKAIFIHEFAEQCSGITPRVNDSEFYS